MALVRMNLNTVLLGKFNEERGWGREGGLKKSDLMGKDFFRLCMG